MFSISLEKNKIQENFSTIERFLEEGTDNVKIDSCLALTMEACERLQDLNLIKFIVNGFGESVWNVDVWYDLSTVVEQLHSFFEWLDNEQETIFELDFFGQGVERSLFFKAIGEEVEIECKSRTNWQPAPNVEISNLLTLDKMFTQLLKVYVSEIRCYLSDLAENQYFLEWCQLPYIYKRLQE